MISVYFQLFFIIFFMKYLLTGVFILTVVIAGIFIFRKQFRPSANTKPVNVTKPPSYPLSIDIMRSKLYPGSEIVIEETLSPESNYNRYIASYKSDGLKIYALLTVPKGNPPAGGWPVIIFNHGYIPPEVYRTTERYIAYVDALARNGYIVFKPDFRGNGQSEGQPEGAYYSPAYAVDDLNAITSIKKYKEANPNRIGVWGHSMGGNVALRDIVVNLKDIKATVIWAGVVGSYSDLMNNWQRKVPYQPSERELALRNRNRQKIIQQYGTPETNPEYWRSIDPTYFISDITTPVQLHHGLADEEVPVLFSEELKNKLEKAGKSVELYTYPGADHNISGYSFNIAMEKTINFFNRYLK